MPLWPFLMLVGIFVAVLFLPPLVAAYIDYQREEARSRALARADSDQPDRRAGAGG